MSQYDFSLQSEPTTSKQKQQTTTDALANYYAGGTLIGFVLGTNVTTRRWYFNRVCSWHECDDTEEILPSASTASRV